MERIFVIGDIHGCKAMLLGLLDVIRYEPSQDRLLFVGDYIDRGPDSKGVVDLILELKALSQGKVECVLGNHEALLLDVIWGFGLELYLYNGGGATLKSYGTNPRFQDVSWLPDTHREFFTGLLPYIDLGDFLIVHAGLLPGRPLEEQALEDLLWIREPFIYSDFDFKKRIIFGHTPFREPLVMKNKVGIDTGAVYGNKLTALELREFRFYCFPS